MKTRVSFWLSLLSVTMLSTATHADSGRTDLNPAFRYYQAFLAAPEMSEAEMDYLGTNYYSGQKLPERYGELVDKYDNEFGLLREAARATVPCDWGIDMSPGPATLLPHLARCKAAAIGARYRVLWHLQQGRQAEARDDFLAAFVLARNASRDGTLIATLVQDAAEAILCTVLAENFRYFSPETFRQLVEGVNAAPAPGTVAGSIRNKEAVSHRWFIDKVVGIQKANPGNEAKAMRDIRELFHGFEIPENVKTNLWDQLVQAAGGTTDGVLRLIRDENRLYERTAALMALPQSEFEEQVKQFKSEMEAAGNPLITIDFPAFERARQREFKILVWEAMLHAAGEYRLHGEAGVQSVKDPCGGGPFAFRRFVFEGVDRGFELKSAFTGSGFPEVMIFVEKPGTVFRVDGPFAGQARGK